MDELLKTLFDYQTFESNTELQGVIDKVHARHSWQMLSDDEADWVAAAGIPETASKRKDPFKDHNELS